MKEKIPILIADDHQLFSHTFAEFINNHTRCKVEAIAKNGKELLQYLNQYKVDLVVLDLNMPEINGIEVIKRIKLNYPSLKIIVVSQYQEQQIIKEIKELGVNGYFVKNNDPDEFVEILNNVLLGRSVFPSLQNEASTNFNVNDNFLLQHNFTKRELEILQLIKMKFSNKKIAELLFISELTVATHTKSICKKLNTSDRMEVYLFAAKNL